MSKYHKLLLPALVVGASLLVPAATAEAKVSVNGEEYDTLGSAIEKVGAAEATFTFTEDETGGVTVPVGAKYTINGGGMFLTGKLQRMLVLLVLKLTYRLTI